MSSQLAVGVIEPTATVLESRPRAARDRFVFIDGLRGIAASMVVMLHTTYAYMPAVPDAMQSPWILRTRYFGGTGVQIFFVISGFVIAHSLRNVVPSVRSIAAFILRRQLRLDPAYWVAIAVTLALTAVGRTLGALSRPLPSFGELLANAFYLHVLTEQLPILDVAWTLCLEIQFYLVFILLLWAVYRVSGRSLSLLPRCAAPILLVTGGASLFFTIPRPGWFTMFWAYFAAGVLVSWAVRRVISAFYPIALLTVMMADAVFVVVQGLPMWVGVVTGVLILGLGANRLTEWAGGRLLQYLGRISYSLYLVHQLIISTIHNQYRRFDVQSPYLEVLSIALTVCAALAVAHLLHIAVEKPTMRLSHRLNKTSWAFGTS